MCWVFIAVYISNEIFKFVIWNAEDKYNLRTVRYMSCIQHISISSWQSSDLFYTIFIYDETATGNVVLFPSWSVCRFEWPTIVYNNFMKIWIPPPRASEVNLNKSYELIVVWYSYRRLNSGCLIKNKSGAMSTFSKEGDKSICLFLSNDESTNV
jgi:hypothetical protein